MEHRGQSTRSWTRRKDFKPIVVGLFYCRTLLYLSGCTGNPTRMPTPNLYADQIVNPFDDVDPVYRSNKVDVLYFTDRQPESVSGDDRTYGSKRSRSVAFGVSTVQFGGDNV